MKPNAGPFTPLKILLLVVLALTAPIALGLEARLPDTHPGLHALKPGGALARLDGTLSRLYLEFLQHRRAAPTVPFHSRNHFIRVSRGRVLVDARAAGDAEALLADLDRLGLQRGSAFGDTVSGWLPIGVVRQAAALGNLRALSASIPLTNAGSVTSQGDLAQRSDIARTLYGVSGAGVKVGVLSDSYDHLGGAAADVAGNDLPTGVQVIDDSANCGDAVYPAPCTDEGRAMLQIVHDVAPGAALAFHTAFNGFAGFANGILALADAGAGVIVDDVIYLGEPMFMDGVIAQAIDQVKGDGVAYFSAAGNQARDSYEHGFVNSGEMLYIDIGGVLWPAGYMHDFDPGPFRDTTQEHTIPAGQCAIFSVQWDSPFGSAAAGTGTQNDLDVWLLDSTETLIVAWDAHENIPTGEPVEILQFCNDGLFAPTSPPVFKLVIALWDGAEPGLMKTVLFGSAAIDAYATHSGSLYGHANAAGAVAVGAAYYRNTPEFGVSPPLLESFSSAGGTPILFAADGTRLAAPEVRMQPAVVAPDGVNTTFFYPGSDRDGDGTPDFSGTSAAAPHAAGVAALMLEARPTASPDAVQAALESTAIDMLAAGYDPDSGHGLVRADQAVAAIGAANLPPTAAFTWSPDNLDVQFTDQSGDDDGTVVAWSWNFGDGGTSGVRNPSHSYGTAGTYTVTLTVTDDGDATDSTSQPVTVSAPPGGMPPSAAFTYACDRLACSFDASGSSDDGTITGYAWDFGDGSGGSGLTAGHTYSAAGTYPVELTVTDDDAETGTATADVQAKSRGKSAGSGGASDGGGDTGGGGSCPPAKAAKGKC
ncbi:PKD domain-containing protein [Thioalbus denitrificans]|uniref:PKD domain-containing protein n=1 Tax=Thioalbus denitrificans TaxID=547122 RepID=A0A369CH17_9GAMM|nr:PKD domain-containing protein [Thioalbus denitrificans]RCX31777.1 PKD domain-containing protein [Thioalbus denitrificans]